MRMKRSRLRKLWLRNKSIEKDGEGVASTVYADPVELTGEIWPAGGKLQTEMYGQHVNNMVNCRIRGKYEVKMENGHLIYDFGEFQLQEGDGLCIYTKSTDDPDFKIVSIKPYSPLYMEVEKR